MSITISAGTAYRKAYSGFSPYTDKSYRTNSTNRELVKADRSALSKGLSMLKDLDYENTDPNNTKGIYNRITSLVDVFNNAEESMSKSDSRDIKRSAGEMTKIAKKYSKELEAMGISISSSGKLKIDAKEFKKATTKQVKKIFSEDSEFTKDLEKLMKKVKGQINRQPAPPSVKPEAGQADGNVGGIDTYA